jgi:hypothetical protein
MAREAGFTPSGERIVETFDEDSDNSEFVSYHFGRSSATKENFFPDDPAPLFLSNQVEEPRKARFGRTKDKGILSSLTFKTTIVAAAAATLLFSVSTVENPLTLFANAKASLIGVAMPPSSASPSATTPVQSTTEARASAVAGREGPSRDEIAAAFKAVAHQNQPETRQPAAAAIAPAVAAPTPAAPVRRLSADDLAGLIKRAKNLIATGDIPPARLLLERAADAQDASAALLLAQTYDPAVLGAPDTRSIIPDPVLARSWYEKAAKFGSPEAQQRLAQMQN